MQTNFISAEKICSPFIPYLLERCAARWPGVRWPVSDSSSVLTRDHQHLYADGKDIDVFTEHVVELRLAHHYVRVCDDVRCWDEEALRVRVRDVDRRRARVTDHESVMNVLTECVKESELLRMRTVFGEQDWKADRQEVRFNETKQERVEFGDIKDDAGFETEPVVTLPDDEEFVSKPTQTPISCISTVTIEELDDKDKACDVNAAQIESIDLSCHIHDKERNCDTFKLTPAKVHVSSANEDVQADNIKMVPNTSLESTTKTGLHAKVLSNEYQPDTLNHEDDTSSRSGFALEHKWSRRNRSGSCGFIDLKSPRRRSWKLMPLRRHQSAATCVK